MAFIKSNKLKRTLKSFVLASSVLAGVYCVTSPAQSANIKIWQLKFFDDSGTQVGSGQFKYDLDTTDFIETEYVPDEGFFVNTELTSFSANILGTDWSLDDRAGQLWWEPSSSTVKGTIRDRTAIFLGDIWFFSDQFFNETFLTINESSGDQWFQQLDNGNIFNSGTWTAQAIPEPFTILGSLTALGFGIGFKRYQKKRNT